MLTQAEIDQALAERSPQEIADQAEIMRLVGQGFDSETASRVVLAKYKRGPKASAVKRDQQRFAPRDFQLMR